jgi:hypothetical protein
MSTGRAALILSLLAMAALSGCASVAEPGALLSATELDSMIRVEVVPVEEVTTDETVVAALQP